MYLIWIWYAQSITNVDNMNLICPIHNKPIPRSIYEILTYVKFVGNSNSHMFLWVIRQNNYFRIYKNVSQNYKRNYEIRHEKLNISKTKFTIIF